MLQVNSARKSYGGKSALKAFELNLEAGQKVAIIGPNGSGKSTLLQLLSGVLDPTSGSCALDGKAIHELPRKEVAKRVAYLQQSASYAFAPKVHEFIALGLYANLSRFGQASASQLDSCKAAADQFSVRQFWDRSIDTLSGGELQRVRLARTVVAGGDIWLLDEPTNALDPKHAVSFLDVVSSQSDRLVIASVHDLSLIDGTFDHIIVLKDGGLLAYGRTEDVLTAETLQQTFDIDATGLKHGNKTAWLLS